MKDIISTSPWGPLFKIKMGFERGTIGIDLNVFPFHIAWAEAGKYGDLMGYGELSYIAFCAKLL